MGLVELVGLVGLVELVELVGLVGLVGSGGGKGTLPPGCPSLIGGVRGLGRMESVRKWTLAWWSRIFG